MSRQPGRLGLVIGCGAAWWNRSGVSRSRRGPDLAEQKRQRASSQAAWLSLTMAQTGHSGLWAAAPVEGQCREWRERAGMDHGAGRAARAGCEGADERRAGG